MSFPPSGCFGRALLSGHCPFQMGIKTTQGIVTAAEVNGAVPVRGESDKPPNSQTFAGESQALSFVG